MDRINIGIIVILGVCPLVVVLVKLWTCAYHHGVTHQIHRMHTYHIHGYSFKEALEHELERLNGNTDKDEGRT